MNGRKAKTIRKLAKRLMESDETYSDKYISRQFVSGYRSAKREAKRILDK